MYCLEGTAMRKTENTGYRYDLVSKHRKLLMGCAIIGVLLCHWKTALSSQGIGGNYLAQILNHFGVEGLEIFMFVSGFGLYYSQKKAQTELRGVPEKTSHANSSGLSGYWWNYLDHN